MGDLVRWLGEQLDADQRDAERGILAAEVPDDFDGLTREGMVNLPRLVKARVLREIDGRRRTLIRCEEAMLTANPMLVHFAKQTLREMALPYEGRPGYVEATASVE